MYYVYIITNNVNSIFYIGVTNDLARRIYEHREKLADGFSKKYNLGKLVYFEVAESAESAIIREKQLKNWHRDWKIRQISQFNPKWNDLYSEILK